MRIYYAIQFHAQYITFSLIKLFACLPTTDAQTALTRYFALLHYAKIEHAILNTLVPPPSKALEQNIGPSLLSFAKSIPLKQILLFPFLLPFLFHIPGYIAGHVAGRALAVKGEEESQAQFKAVGGGLGIGVGMGTVIGLWWKRMMLAVNNTEFFPWFHGHGNTTLGLIGLLYLGVVILIKWHNLLFHGVCTSYVSIYV